MTLPSHDIIHDAVTSQHASHNRTATMKAHVKKKNVTFTDKAVCFLRLQQSAKNPCICRLQSCTVMYCTARRATYKQRRSLLLIRGHTWKNNAFKISASSAFDRSSEMDPCRSIVQCTPPRISLPNALIHDLGLPYA